MTTQHDDVEERARMRLGTTLRGKYRLERVLGIGGMATVYAATHRNGREVAIKLLHPELSLGTDMRNRFLREGHAANAVKHSGAVAVLDDDVAEDGGAFLVMELLRGESLEDLWERSARRLPLDSLAVYGEQLLDVLAAAHGKGIVHRDIKPANIFLATREDGSQVIKVLDFGIARLRDAASSVATQTGMMMGTPAFMAPEQARAKTTEIDAQTDVWAAGATLFTLASGELVHEGDNAQDMLINAATTPARSLTSVMPDAPPAFVRIVDRALAFDKPSRWPSAAAMRDALREVHLELFGRLPPPRPTGVSIPDPGERALAATMPSDPGGVVPPVSAPAPGVAFGSHAGGTGPSAAGPSAAVSARAFTPMVGQTTAMPVSSGKAGALGGSRRGRGVIWASVAGLGLVVAAVAIVAIVRGSHGSAPSASNAASTTATAAGTATATATDTGTATATATDTGTAGAANAPSVARSSASLVTPPAPVKTVATSTATPTSTATAISPPKPNCTPPFEYDAKGVKRWKPGCL